jgi:hypothetical protein
MTIGGEMATGITEEIINTRYGAFLEISDSFTGKKSREMGPDRDRNFENRYRIN